MRFRYTMKELRDWSDYDLLKRVVTERQSDTNIYSPLARRLIKLHEKLEKKQSLTKNPIPEQESASPLRRVGE